MTQSSLSSRGDKRRAEILRTSLALFNDRGTTAVSTNHVAAELGISVGNLYWHFHSKEEIIRSLFDDLHSRFDGVWAPPRSVEEAAETAVRALRRAFGIAWGYRFIYRELASLTRADPELRKRHAAARAQRSNELRALLAALVAVGALRLPPRAKLRAQLEDLSWMITSFWLPHVELRDGTSTKRSCMGGVEAVLGLYLPYATDGFARELAAALDAADGGA